jgi:isocitrate dehydrogenase (NAD+)
MKLSDGLFRGTCAEIGKNEYPNIEYNDLIVDNATMQAVSKPQQFDVLVMPNLYGSILSNVGAALVGGPGVIPAANVGREFAVFEPGCRHVGLDSISFWGRVLIIVAGKGQANPTGLILSACMMLRHLGLDHYANRISTATYNVLAEGYALQFIAK